MKLNCVWFLFSYIGQDTNLTLANLNPELFISNKINLVEKGNSKLSKSICKSIEDLDDTGNINHYQSTKSYRMVLGLGISCKGPIKFGLLILPSFCPTVCLGNFLELYHQFFLNFGMELETHLKLWVTAVFSRKKFLPQKFSKWTENGSKTGFLNLLETLVINFYWICSIMKIYINCCVPTQIPYLGIFLLLWYGLKMSLANLIAGFFINPISIINQWNSLILCMLKQIHINYLEVDQRIFGWAWSKIVVFSLIMGL